MKLEDMTEEALIAQLDQDKPDWVIQWADQRDLQQLAEGSITMSTVRTRVFNSVVWPSVRALYCLTKK